MQSVKVHWFLCSIIVLFSYGKSDAMMRGLFKNSEEKLQRAFNALGSRQTNVYKARPQVSNRGLFALLTATTLGGAAYNVTLAESGKDFDWNARRQQYEQQWEEYEDALTIAIKKDRLDEVKYLLEEISKSSLDNARSYVDELIRLHTKRVPCSTSEDHEFVYCACEQTQYPVLSEINKAAGYFVEWQVLQERKAHEEYFSLRKKERDECRIQRIKELEQELS